MCRDTTKTMLKPYLPSSSKTINLCRQLEKCGVTFLTVHGRTPTQKIGEPSNSDYLAEIKKSIGVPLIANGDVKSLAGADSLYKKINCDGIMAARGMLSNPAMFSGAPITPFDCIQNWTDLMHAAGDSVTFQCLHHHLTFMMEKLMIRRTRVSFNNLTRKHQVYDFLQQNYDIVPRPDAIDVLLDDAAVLCEYDAARHAVRMSEAAAAAAATYNSETTQGQYYLSQLDSSNDCDLDYMETSLFDT